MPEMNKTTDIRCRAIIVHDNKILAVKHSAENGYYALPGGHLEWGESVLDCLKREIVEELGIRPEIGRLLYVRNFIDKNDKRSIEFHFEIANSADYQDINKLKGTHSHELAEICWIGKNDTRVILPEQVQTDLNNGNIFSDTVRFS